MPSIFFEVQHSISASHITMTMVMYFYLFFYTFITFCFVIILGSYDSTLCLQRTVKETGLFPK